MALIHLNSMDQFFLQIWIDINPVVNKYLHPLYSVGWKCLSIPKLQQFHHLNLGHVISSHIFIMLGLKWNHVSKRGPRKHISMNGWRHPAIDYVYTLFSPNYDTPFLGHPFETVAHLHPIFSGTSRSSFSGFLLFLCSLRALGRT